MATSWQDIASAPRDGTKIILRVRHVNWDFEKTPEKKSQWEQECQGKWIDHNGGGFTWDGLCGAVIGWRPIEGDRS